jgi:glycosyltransferase involved in cell wall biosynthesis
VENNQVTSSKKAAILYLCFPHASPVVVKHAERLLNGLVPVCGRVIVAGDPRVGVGEYHSQVTMVNGFPVLHRRESVHPQIWSILLWIAKLVWIQILASWTLIRSWRHFNIIVSFLGVMYTPTFFVGRIFRKKVIYFEPTGTIIAEEKVFPKIPGGKALLKINRALRRFNRSMASVCVVQSENEIIQGDFESDIDKVRVLYSIVDTQFYRNEVPLVERPLKIGYIGRFSHAKGTLELIEASKLIKKQGVSLRLVGDGLLRDSVSGLVRKTDYAHVELFGWGDENEVVKHLNSIRLLVLPTIAEGIPNILLEAMACGTPVLATNVGGIPDLIEHNVTGFTLPDLNPTTIAKCIQQALAHPELEQVAERAQDHIAQNFSLAACSQRWREILGELED